MLYSWAPTSAREVKFKTTAFNPDDTEAFAASMKAAREQWLKAFDDFFSAQTTAHESAAHRQSVVLELCTTETDFLTDLRTLENVWQRELEKSGVLTPQELGALFNSIQVLVMLAQEMSTRLAEEKAKPPSKQSVGAVFTSLIPYFKVYVEYCNSQITTHELITAFGKSGTKYKEAADKIRAVHPELKGLDLGAYLIKPAQRITKYPLFLKDLISHTSPDHRDYASLEHAKEEMEKVLKEINQRTRKFETDSLLGRCSIEWKHEPAIDLRASGSLLIKEGKVSLNVTGSQKPGNYVMIFDNVIIVLRASSKDEFKEMAFFETASLKISDHFKEDCLTLHHPLKGVLEFRFSCFGESVNWLNSVKDAIAQAPVAKPLKFEEEPPAYPKSDSETEFHQQTRERQASFPRSKGTSLNLQASPTLSSSSSAVWAPRPGQRAPPLRTVSVTERSTGRNPSPAHSPTRSISPATRSTPDGGTRSPILKPNFTIVKPPPPGK
eukprot:m51a1_g9132 putative domain containing protein (495) ;mRNA; r:36451-38468